MALKAVVEKVDDVPEPVRGFYQEKDGKFILDVEPTNGFALEDITSLKSSLGKERTKRTQLEKEIEKFKDLDPEKARDALLKLEELGNIDPLKEADKIVETRLKAATGQLVDKHHKEIERIAKEKALVESAYESMLVNQAATIALSEAKGDVDLLMPHVQRQTRVRKLDDGRRIVEVIDKDGNVRIANSAGDPMTITDLVQEMRKSDKYGRGFEGTGNSGSGMRPSSGGGTPQSKYTKKSDFKNEHERAAWVDANGLEAYDALPR